MSIEHAGNYTETKSGSPQEPSGMETPLSQGTFRTGKQRGSQSHALACVLSWVLLQLVLGFPQLSLLCCFPWM